MFPAQPDPDPARLALGAHRGPGDVARRRLWQDDERLYREHVQPRHADEEIGPCRTGNKTAKSNDGQLAKDETIHDQSGGKGSLFRSADGSDCAAWSMRRSASCRHLIDPRMRDGLARSMARRFDARQLADINAFFATPSGHALASQYMQLWFEPDTMRSMMGAFPR